MLETLQFVRGAVSDRDLVVPVLTHFCVYGGRIQGANGRIAIDSPCPELTFEAVVPADRFLRAVDACRGEPKLKFNEGGKLTIERKPFRAFLPYQPVSLFPQSKPTAGKKVKMQQPLLKALARARAFMSDDAERPWASTVYFSVKDGIAYAAANTMIASVASAPFKQDVQLPTFCIDELLRINREPDCYVNDDTSMTFFWGDHWMRTQKIVADWPLKTAQDHLSTKAKMVALPDNLIASVERLIPFCNDRKFPVIYFRKGGLSTAPGEVQAEINGFDLGEGAFHSDNLLPMLKHSNKMCIGERAAVFAGPESFRGVMSVLKL